MGIAEFAERNIILDKNGVDAMGEVQAMPTDNTLLKRLKDLHFGGAVYENQNIASADAARRFETNAKKLRDVLIRVDTYAQYFGGSGNHRMEVGAGDYMWITKVDISSLYFKNKVAGQNGVVTVLGVEE